MTLSVEILYSINILYTVLWIIFTQKIYLKGKRIHDIHFMGGYQPPTLVYVPCIDACVSTMTIAALSVMCLLLFSFTVFMLLYIVVTLSYCCTDI